MNFFKIASITALTTLAVTVQAAPLSVWDDTWTQITAEETSHPRFVSPGTGGQAFDAEYLYYKVENDHLYVGLQTGFDLTDGRYRETTSSWWGHTYSTTYWTGDIALSFDGDDSTYEYGIDFGYRVKDHDGDRVGPGRGKQTAGLYSVDTWNTDILHPISSPFAIEEGGLLQEAIEGENFGISDSYEHHTGPLGNEKSTYAWMAIDMNGLGLTSDFALDLHWTMSCGNDAIDGHVERIEVPEPGSFALMGLGLAGLFAARRRVKKA